MNDSRNALLRGHRGLLHQLFFSTHVDAREADLAADYAEELVRNLRDAKDTVRDLLVEAGGELVDDADWELPATRDQYWALLRGTGLDICSFKLQHPHAQYLVDELQAHSDLVVAIVQGLHCTPLSPKKPITTGQIKALTSKTGENAWGLNADGGLTVDQAGFLLDLLAEDPAQHKDWAAARVREVRAAIKPDIAVESTTAARPTPRGSASAPRTSGSSASRLIVLPGSVTLRRTEPGASLELPGNLGERIPADAVFTVTPTEEGIVARRVDTPSWLLPAGERSSFVRHVSPTWHIEVPSGVAERVPDGTQFSVELTEEGILFRRIASEFIPSWLQ